MVKVKPARGRVVKDRTGKLVSGEIEVNERDLFWAALIRWGDVTIVRERTR
ncbi:MAG: hypothetical protein ABF968_07360 [Acetobacter sp.]|uniref:hypothetical protein n=1 Tax=Acetobacter sp. TaxID=440 RepID=UPI0039ECC3CA